ncbi:MAG TPA: GNAT family protein [Candidatus Limnocylindrales bacterium]|nr:GNAT family protein [Candidatus Limnocylindrales bacterium]
MAHPLWPLFDLRLRIADVELRLPTDDELVALAAVARAGMHEPDEMPFGVAWSTVASPEFERSFARHHWEARASWSRTLWSLHLATFLDGRPIGAQSLLARDFPTLRAVHTGSWLGLAWQGQGYGKTMRAAVLGFAFDHLGAELAETEAFLDNERSAGVSRSLGYEPNGLGRLAPEGVARDTQRFRMTLDGWRSRPRPALDVAGFDACRELFGLEGTDT